jgi:hypothetical protein
VVKKASIIFLIDLIKLHSPLELLSNLKTEALDEEQTN